MDVVSVDERDQRWEVPFPTYRVYFWDNPVGHPVGYTAYTYELTHAHNVQQVLAWADANARGRTYQVFVAYDDSERGVGLFSLCGSAPTNPRDPRAVPPLELRAEEEVRVPSTSRDSGEQAEVRVRRWLHTEEPKLPEGQ